MPIHPYDLRTNLLSTPLGIDTPQPEFAWKIGAESASTGPSQQSAYAIEVARSETFAGELVWQSGHVASTDQLDVLYEGLPLLACTRYYWRVRCWDAQGAAGDWSTASWFETAMLSPTAFTANWITCPGLPEEEDDTSVYLRGRLELPSRVVRGRAYVSAQGWYRLFVNAQDMTGNALVPRFTPMNKVLEYQTYDITEHCHVGTNIIALAIGDGRYRGRLGFLGCRAQFGERLAGFAQIELALEDGQHVTFSTDGRWHAGPGRITGSDPKFGERVDLRISDSDWLRSLHPPARFAPVDILPPTSRQLIAEEVQRVQEVTRLPPRRIWRSPSGKQLVDFGQNFAGVVSIQLPAQPGRAVQLTHSEVLTTEGELDVSWIWHGPKWFQRDHITLSATAQRYQPWFTIHGFRYVEVNGLDEDLRLEDIEGIVLSTAFAVVGQFECSDARLNQLYQNVFWSLRSNFTDTATDCPTRERSGWTGDIQVFGPASTTLVDDQAFLRRYLRNVALDQLDDGRVPPWIPFDNIRRKSARFIERFTPMVASSTGWGDVAVMLPWTLYRYFGDKQVLGRQYESMKRWVDYMAREAPKVGITRWFKKRFGAHERYLLDTGFHFGEWLRPGENDMQDMKLHKRRFAPAAVVATAYFAQSSRLLSQAAGVLGRLDDERYYADLSEKVRAAWRVAFIHADGRIGEDKQDDYVRALAFDLLAPEQRSQALERLVQLIERADDHLGTGFLSTGMLLPVLAAHGRADVAFRLLMQTSNPSWLYLIQQGATTVWETWGGYDDKGKAINSHNHYALGAVVGWLQEGVAGLAPLEPGYRRILIAPNIGGGLTHASASLQTPFGLAQSRWHIEAGQVRLTATVPSGTSAEVRHGNGQVSCVGPGTHQFSWELSSC